jgi:hypothetical protein
LPLKKGFAFPEYFLTSEFFSVAPSLLVAPGLGVSYIFVGASVIARDVRSVFALRIKDGSLLHIAADCSAACYSEQMSHESRLSYAKSLLDAT